ncbi:MAG: chemotaxis protein CheX [Phycisphaeraceae bacterium]|nr:MAG: chemotaxis protein CheX [Phycisphaeraceae bacterium]
MDVRYINPFIEAVRSVFSTMIKIDVTLEKPHVAEILPRYDISGIIGMSGDVVGSVVLSFPAPVAKVVVGKFAGGDFAVTSPDFADALGEIVNMISGAAKAKFEGKNVSISTPSVIVGSGHTVTRPTGTVCISLPCKVYCGEFSIDIAIREENRQAKAA